MMNILYKKVFVLLGSIRKLYIDSVSHIVFLALVLGFIIYARQLPYFNIIPNYNDYSIFLFIVLLVIFARKKLTIQRFFIIIESILIVTLISELLLLSDILEFLGFLIFTLVLLSITVGFIFDRRSLKDTQ